MVSILMVVELYDVVEFSIEIVNDMLELSTDISRVPIGYPVGSGTILGCNGVLFVGGEIGRGGDVVECWMPECLEFDIVECAVCRLRGCV